MVTPRRPGRPGRHTHPNAGPRAPAESFTSDMKTTPLVVAVLGIALTLTACSGDGDASTESGATGDTTTSVAQDAPEVDRDPQGELPPITFGEDGIPTMEAIDSDPPTAISVTTLEAGDGETVSAGDYITVNYAGFLWTDGTQFDSSFSTGTPASFGLNQVVDGWKYGLVDTKVGDRVQIVIPPEFGYGDQESGTIPANSTLVFVVDILNTVHVTTDALGDATASDATLPDGLSIEGELGTEPTVTFAEGAAEPTEASVVMLAEGTGPAITATDTVFYHAVGGYWGEQPTSSWAYTYQAVAGGGGAETIGVPVGSRLLLLYPADEATGTPAQALVVDILGATPSE